jgi:hypothetical protein
MVAAAQTRVAQVTVSLSETLGPLEINRYGLGQGGQSDELMCESRLAEIRALDPRLIRLFVMEFFNPLPVRNRYNFGKGKLLITSLNLGDNLDEACPEAVFLVDRLLRYITGSRFTPSAEVDSSRLGALLR